MNDVVKIVMVVLGVVYIFYARPETLVLELVRFGIRSLFV